MNFRIMLLFLLFFLVRKSFISPRLLSGFFLGFPHSICLDLSLVLNISQRFFSLGHLILILFLNLDDLVPLLLFIVSSQHILDSLCPFSEHLL